MNILWLVSAAGLLGSPAFAQGGPRAMPGVAVSSAAAAGAQRLSAVRDDGSVMDDGDEDGDDDSGVDEAGNPGGGALSDVSQSSAPATDAPKAPDVELSRACQNEISFLCRDEQQDQESLLDCLEDNKAGLTSGCRTVFFTLRPQRNDE